MMHQKGKKNASTNNQDRISDKDTVRVIFLILLLSPVESDQ